MDHYSLPNEKSITSPKSDALIFHNDRYVSEVLAKTLRIMSYNAFDIPDDLIKSINIKTNQIHIFESEIKSAAAILERTVIRVRDIPVHFYSFSTKDYFMSELRRFSLFPEFKHCETNGMIIYHQIPCMLSELTREGLSLEDNGKVSVIRSRIADRVAEAADKSLRHGMRNAEAASRIMNGAIESGDYDISDSRVYERTLELYTNMVDNAGWSENVKKSKKEAMNRYLEDTKFAKDLKKRSSEQQISWSDKHRLRKILIIDDEKIWEPVWEFILSDKVDFCSSGEQGITKIKTKKESYDCILLDINLNGDKNGLEVLQEIKNEILETPVIMMTACNHSELTKKCLQLGAESYFVKSLDEERKSSIEYYEHLRDLIINTSNHFKNTKDIWKKFAIIEGSIKDLDIKYETQIGAMFRKAFYFLTLNENHVLANTLLIPEWLSTDPGDDEKPIPMQFAQPSPARQLAEGQQSAGNQAVPSSKYNGAAFYLNLAVENICMAKQRMDNPKMTIEEAIEIISKNDDNFYKLMQETFPKMKSYQYRTMADTFPKVRHAYITPKVPINETSSIDCAKEVINILKTLNLINKRIESTAPTMIDVSKYLNTVYNTHQSHEERSKAGAKIFEDVLQDAECPTVKHYQKKHTVLFIDDDNKSSAWYLPLKSYFGKKNISFDSIDKYTDNIELNKYSLILLDFVFRNDDKSGLDYLKIIREKSIAIPIIMLTADNSSFNARRCLFNGADDYFVKETHDDNFSYFSMFESLINFYIDQIDGLERQSWWVFIQSIKHNYGALDGEKIKLLSNSRYLTNKDVEVLHKLLRFPLREAYFYYRMHINQGQTIDAWKAQRLLTESNGVLNSFYLSLGKFIELLMLYMSFIQGNKDKEHVGYWIDKLLLYPVKEKQYCKEVWNFRIQAKLGKIIDADPHRISRRLFNIFRDFSFYKKSDVCYIEEKNKAFFKSFINLKSVIGIVVDQKSDINKERVSFIAVYIQGKNFPPVEGICFDDENLEKGREYKFEIDSIDYLKGQIKLKKIRDRKNDIKSKPTMYHKM